MARQRQPRSVYGDIYTQLMIQRMLQKQQADRELAAQRAANPSPAGPGIPPLEEGNWSSLPGAENASVPYVVQGDPSLPSYQRLHGNSEVNPDDYYDRGRTWRTPEEWSFFGPSVDAYGNQRIPDWERVPGSGLGPVPSSPQLQELRSQVGDLHDLGARNTAMRNDNSRLLNELSRVIAEGDQKLKIEQAYDVLRGNKPMRPGIADIYGPYDSSQDVYADAPSQQSPKDLIGGTFPENPMPGPPRWGAGATPAVPMGEPVPISDIVEGLKGEVRGAARPDIQMVPDPEKPGKFIPGGKSMSWGLSKQGLDQANQYRYNRGLPISPVGDNKETLIDESPPVTKMVKGKRVVLPNLGPASWSPPTPEELEFLRKKSAPNSGWSSEVPQPSQQAIAKPQGPSLWDNYDPAFVEAMHSADPAQIEQWEKDYKGPWVL